MKTLFFLGLSFSFLFCACTKKTEAVVINNPQPPVTPVQVKSYGYLALGDSYTIGQSVETYQNFPNQLVDQMKVSGYTTSTKIIAQTGWTTGNLINAINSATLNPKYDFVSLLIGVNNQYQGGSIDAYREGFVNLLKTSIAFAGGNASHVFVLSIPDWGVTPYAGNNADTKARIGAEIDAFNRVNKEESEKLKANYLDITPISREAKSNPGLIAGDGLHPSAQMYKAWVKLLAPQVLSKL